MIKLQRPPANPDELWHVVNTLWGVAIPRHKVCPEHSSPFAAFADAYFAHDPNWALWYGSRGTGKSYMLALLGLNKAALLDAKVTLLGGSMAQSINVREHVDALLRGPNSPRYALAKPPTATEVLFSHGNWIRPLPASQTTVRGPHPALTCLDEIDEMDYDIYTAAQGQAMPTRSSTGDVVPEMLVASSTWQYPSGCMISGTLVTTQDGSKAIEDIHTGDMVLTRNGYRRVLEAHVMGMQPVITVTMNSGATLTCTPWHPFWVDGSGWVEASKLVPGSTLAHTVPASQHVVLPNPDPVGGVAVDTQLSALGVDLPDHRGTSVVLGVRDDIKMTRIDTSPVATCVIQDEACRDFSDDLLVHPAMRIPNASATVESPIGLNAVPFVVEVQRPYDTVVGVEVEGHVFESDRVVSVSHDEILAPTYDLTVESEPEYIANGILVHNTFTKVITEARQKKLPIHTWCFKEVLKTESNPTGWMTEEFIERKRLSVPAEMFRVEYELGEPAGGARAFDLTALEDTFVHMEPLRHTDKGSDEELVFEEYHRKGVYAAGADWAKEKDFTVITVIRVDCDPWRTVYVRKMNRRPWPYMIGQFNEIVSRYQAVSAHDATGLGNVVHDLVDERTSKILMVGKDRTKLLTDYITAVERGKYQMPRNSPLYEAHRSVTVDEVFGGGQWNSHLADEVAACAIAHRAAATQAPPAFGQIVPRGKQRAKWMEELDGTSRASSAQVLSEVGIVTVQEEVSDVGVFWLP